MKVSETPLISAQAIEARIAALAGEISAACAEERPVLVCVLRGALPFARAIMHHLRFSCTLDFVRAKSYADTESTGAVQLLRPLAMPVRGRHVILLEDILDTGRTAHAIMEYIGRQEPASIRICALLDKPARRIAPVAAQWRGFEIPDAFVVGFGLDLDERFRELPDIRTLA
jgi:hypoxanthine phosphoribosyltransferase